jgi:hypothetical protein
MEMHERLTRGGEIQQELDKLYAELMCPRSLYQSLCKFSVD